MVLLLLFLLVVIELFQEISIVLAGEVSVNEHRIPLLSGIVNQQLSKNIFKSTVTTTRKSTIIMSSSSSKRNIVKTMIHSKSVSLLPSLQSFAFIRILPLSTCTRRVPIMITTTSKSYQHEKQLIKSRTWFHIQQPNRILQNQQQQQQQQWYLFSTTTTEKSSNDENSSSNKDTSKNYEDNDNNDFYNDYDSSNIQVPTYNNNNFFGGGSSNTIFDDTVTTATPSGTTSKLHRADRVLANRSGRSRSDCFRLLKEKRVEQFVLRTTTDIVQPIKKKRIRNKNKKLNIDNKEDTFDDNEDSEEDSSAVQHKLSMNDQNSDDDNNRNNIENDNYDDTVLSSSSSSSITTSSYGYWEVVQGPGSKLSMDVQLRVDKTNTIPLLPPLVCMYHKPKWVLSVLNDPKLNRPCVQPPNKMHPIGRLDYDSSGLLLFSSNGQITQSILHPKYGIYKTYVATVAGIVDETILRQQLANGIETSLGIHTGIINTVSYPYKTAEQVTNYLQSVIKDLPYNVTQLEQLGYMDILTKTKDVSIIELQVNEGKYRMVRRMLNNIGHPVIDLHRTKIGPILSLDIDPGCTRRLQKDEIEWIQSLVHVEKDRQQQISKHEATLSSTSTSTSITPIVKKKKKLPPSRRKKEKNDTNDNEVKSISSSSRRTTTGTSTSSGDKEKKRFNKQY